MHEFCRQSRLRRAAVLLGLGVCVALCQAPRSAHARDAATTASAPVQADRPSHWYGLQTLLADAASLGLLIGGTASDDPVTMALGSIGFVVATPLIHGLHDSRGWARGSAMLRIGALVLTLSGGFLITLDPETEADTNKNTVGYTALLLGIATGLVMPFVDMGLATERPPPACPRLALTPMLSPHDGLAGLVLSGSL